MKCTKTFLTWLVFFNWPAAVMWIPRFGLLFIFPALFWINVPALWLGLAKMVGYRHFEIAEFGAEPKTLFAWLIIFLYWTLVAAMMTGVTVLFRALFGQDENSDVAAERNKESITRLQDSLRHS